MKKCFAYLSLFLVVLFLMTLSAEAQKDKFSLKILSARVNLATGFIYIQGENFGTMPKVMLDTYSLTPETYTDSYIEASGVPTDPMDLPPGTYTLEVANGFYVNPPPGEKDTFDVTICAVAPVEMPLGAIIMWSGTIDLNGNPEINGVPDTNWHICDGTEGTPDLQGRFIVGSGYGYIIGDTGGETSVTLDASQMPSHNHSLSGSINLAGRHSHSLSGSISSVGNHSHPYSLSIYSAGSHSHSYYDAHFTGTETGGLVGNSVADNHTAQSYRSTGSAGNHSHGYSLSISSAGSHTHSNTFSIGYADSHSHSYSFNIGYTGEGSSHENRPPYYALAYIMKIQ